MNDTDDRPLLTGQLAAYPARIAHPALASLLTADDAAEQRRWHDEVRDVAVRQGDDLRLALRWADAEALRLQGLNPQRAAMVLL